MWGLPTVAREVRAWRARARTIPDAPIRASALDALAHKRGNIDGAALFWTLPRPRNLTLIGLLATYEMICDLLDSLNEPTSAADPANGRQLHLALIEALDPGRRTAEHYHHHPSKSDGGYLLALVDACRARSAALPAYAHVRELLLREATRFEIIAINHDRDTSRREHAHRTWAVREFPITTQARWFELTAAATASLTVHALLALAAEPTLEDREIAAVQRAYFPWISATTTMLDHFVDQSDDQLSGDHSYVAYYPSVEDAVQHVNELVSRSLQHTRTLKRGERHTLIVTCMIAMYLSKDSARTPAMRATRGRLARSGGSLTRLLLPVLRLWRVAYAQRST